jgi:replicative DNA helicase
MANTTGHDFFEDAEARFVKINRNPCPTGLDVLDSKDIFRGGLGRGELGVVVAPTGVGKSHWLTAMGAHALKMGKNVVHYTFELTETAVGLRYDSNLCGIPSNEVPDMKEDVLNTYKTMDLGRLIIKEYPTGTATVQMIRNHIEKLSLKGFIPSLIVIDYADIMRSSRTFDSLRHELKLVYEELRNLAMELNLPIWTASQANREASGAEVVGLENMSEAYGKAMVADVVVSISRKPSEKADGSGRLFVAKNRAGKDGVLFPIHIDTAQSRIKILDENSLTLSESMTQDNNDAKKLLRKKWQEVTGTK